MIYRSIKGAALTADEVDGNFQELETGLANAGAGNVLTGVSQDGSVVTLHYANGQDRSFTIPPAEGGLDDAPTDGLAHGRQDGAWVAVVEEAPADGVARARKDGGWVEVASGGGSPAGALVLAGAWVAGTAVTAGQVWSYGGIYWMARGAYASPPAPDFSNEAYWAPVTFPNSNFQKEATARIFHKANNDSIVSVWSAINALYNRLAALDGGTAY